MTNDGLRLGLFLGGLVMAAVPVSVGIGFAVFLFREFKKERSLGEGAPD